MSEQKRPKPNPVNAPEAGQDPVEDQPAGGQESAALGETTDEIEQLRAELEEAKDRVLRAQAELENYRKRVQREMDEQRRYAALPLMRDLLPVLDNMGRAIEAAETTHDTASLLEGVKMVFDQFLDALARHDCSEIVALHEPFDPNLHQAISQQPSADYPANTVVLVSQSGFRLHDRVVRPSQVIVSAPPAEDQEQKQA